MQKIIITIDGYSSCGKSTLARQLSKKLNYIFIDSGAMYRAITLYFLRNNINYTHHNNVQKALKSIHIKFVYNEPAAKSDMYLNNENVETLIREMPVSESVSDVATIKEIREFTVKQQREMGKEKGLVMDGRDIGTVVFPQAELKIFMQADIAIRVQRRFKELLQANQAITIEEVKNNLARRDYLDVNREISPLKKAPDAHILDNSDLTMEEQFNMALKWAKQAIAATNQTV